MASPSIGPGLGPGVDLGPQAGSSVQVIELSSSMSPGPPSGHHHKAVPGRVATWWAGFVRKCRGVPGERSLPLPPPAAILLSGLTAFLGILAISLPLRYSEDGMRGGEAWGSCSLGAFHLFCLCRSSVVNL